MKRAFSVELFWRKWRPYLLVTLGRRPYYSRWLHLGLLTVWWQG